MRVALFSETYCPHINGVVTHVHLLKEGLQACGHEVLVVTADANVRQHTIKDDILCCPGRTFKRFYNYSLSKPLSPARFRALKEFAPDIIHIHNEFGIGLSGMRIAKKLDVPLVYTLHTMWDQYIHYIVPQWLVPVVTPLTHRYERYIFKTAEAVIGPSPKVNDYIQRCKANKQAVVMANAVDIRSFDRKNLSAQARRELRARIGASDADTVIGFCGRMGKEKSVDRLLEFFAKAYAKNPHLRLLLIGGGPELPGLQALAQTLGIAQNLHCTDEILHETTPPYFACCDLYATASLSEVNSISMKEALATGLPVLQLEDPVNSGQIIHGENGYIYQNAESFCAILEQHLQLPAEEQEAARVRARDSVLAAGNEAHACRVTEIYAAVVAAHAKRKVQKQK